MVSMLQSLFAHQAWADAAMFGAVRKQAGAGEDELMRTTLHHIVTVQRAFLSLFLKRPFDLEKEQRVPVPSTGFESLFRETHAEEMAFVSEMEEAELLRPIDMPWIPGLRLTLGEALMQVVMHSQSHRGQCASRLRLLGGAPPMTDFIIWLKNRPAPEWGAA